MRTPALRARSAGHEQLDQQNVGRAMANGLRARGFGEGAISGGLANIKIWCMIVTPRDRRKARREPHDLRGKTPPCGSPLARADKGDTICSCSRVISGAARSTPV